jgi:hypothetical protein
VTQTKQPPANPARFTLAVYNAGTHILIKIEPDQTG